MNDEEKELGRTGRQELIAIVTSLRKEREKILAVLHMLGTSEKEMRDNLTATQVRCSELLQSNRAFHQLVGILHPQHYGPADIQVKVLGEFAAERRRQDEKWGALSEKDFKLPDGTGQEGDAQAAADMKAACDANHKAGVGTWRDILEEEVAEAFAESDVSKLRAELVQVAAVASKWIESIDQRRTTPKLHGG